MTLSRVYSFNVFAPDHRIWMHFVRSTFHQGWWKAEASDQTGRMLHSRLISDEHMHSIWGRFSHLAEVTLFS